MLHYSIKYTLLFLLSLCITFITAIVWVPFAKEGVDSSILIVLVVMSLVFSVQLFLWYLVYQKQKKHYVRILAVISLLMSSILLIITLCSLGYFIKTIYMNHHYENEASISRYQDSFIRWPGFTYPVGLQIEVDLPTPYLKNGNFLAPIIWIGPPITTEMIINSADWSVYSNHQFLVMLSGRYESRQIKVNDKQDTHISYTLFPGALRYVQGPNGFCTFSKIIDSYKHAPFAYAAGSELNASWYYYGTLLKVNLSDPLSKRLNQTSQLKNNIDLWIGMHHQFEDDQELLNLGYHYCSIKGIQHCFCK